MLAYTAGRPRIGERRSSPNALLLVISAHIALVAAVMSVKMDLPSRIPDGPTLVRLIQDEQPPPPNPSTPQPRHSLTQPTVVTPRTTVPTANPTGEAQPMPTLPGAGDAGQLFLPPQPPVNLVLPPLPVRTGPQFLTAPSELKPPYPQSKILSGEEAVLKLRLSIDPSGRVVAVDPIGKADTVFLDAARRYVIAHWRYKPAMDGGQAVASAIVVTLKFQLDD